MPIPKFLLTAPRVRALALRRSFSEMIDTDISDHNELSAEIQEKPPRLWEWPSEDVLADDNASELAGFGRWCGSGKFPTPWANAQFIRVLEAGGGVRIYCTVTQRLSEVAVTIWRTRFGSSAARRSRLWTTPRPLRPRPIPMAMLR
jgi:hypothetical protein